MLTTNPDAPSHWINRRMILGGEASCYFSSARDNPANPKEYLTALNNLTGLEAKRLRDGIWCQAEGVIYTMFGQDNIVDDSYLLPYPSNYKNVFGGADSNYPLPRAGLMFVIKGDTIIVVDEFYRRSSHVEQLCDWYSEKAAIYEKTITVYHDPSDPDAIVRLSNYDGVKGEKANNSVLPGISEVSKMLSEKKLMIHKKCTNLIEELQSYKWKNNGKDEPVKENDHAVDALRYGIMSFNINVKEKDFDYEFI
jgi:PBSX family phage terminase large subunit